MLDQTGVGNTSQVAGDAAENRINRHAVGLFVLHGEEHSFHRSHDLSPSVHRMNVSVDGNKYSLFCEEGLEYLFHSLENISILQDFIRYVFECAGRAGL